MNVKAYVGPNGVLPTYETRGACAFDLRCAKQYEIHPHEYEEIEFDLVIKVPPGCALLILPRNSLFKKHHLIFVGSGLIDQDYHGPDDKINFPVWNASTDEVTFLAEKERIGQGMIIPVEYVLFDHFVPTGPSRGGTGSTGRF